MTYEYIKKEVIKKFGCEFFEKYISRKDEQLSENDEIVFCCPFHGFFSKSIFHIVFYKYLCKDCGIEARNESNRILAKKQRRSQQDIIRELSDIHGNKYYYPYEIESTGKRISVCCKKHGVFEIYYISHKKGVGCRFCRKEDIENKKKEKRQQRIENRPNVVKRLAERLKKLSIPFGEAIKRFKKRHGDRYEYDENSYTNYSSKIRIRCKKHGWFTQLCQEHAKSTHGCHQCSKKISSSKELSWLRSIGITMLQKQIKIKNKTLRVDGFCQETNTVFEFLGDYWHGNPILEETRGISINKISKKTLKQLFKETEERFIDIFNLGYDIIYRWEYKDYDFLFDGKLRY